MPLEMAYSQAKSMPHAEWKNQSLVNNYLIVEFLSRIGIVSGKIDEQEKRLAGQANLLTYQAKLN